MRLLICFFISFLVQANPNISFKIIENGHHDITYALPSTVGPFLVSRLISFSNSE